jgi:iron complex transport system ATP-binding protein
VTRLVVKDLSVRLGKRDIVRDVSLRADAGEWLAVIGPNGAGKSTLLKAIAGVLPCTGRIEIDGQALEQMKVRDRSRQLAMVAQSPIMPEAITVVEYALLGRNPYLGPLARESSTDLDRVHTALADLDVAHLTTRFVATLSGGERQRVLLARVLVQDTPVLLLDEPTTALDVGHQQDVLELIDRLRRERGLTIITTLHDLTVASRYPDRLVLLVDGVVEAEGTALDVLTEDHLARFYGAAVRILCTEDGIIVVPKRGAR